MENKKIKNSGKGKSRLSPRTKKIIIFSALALIILVSLVLATAFVGQVNYYREQLGKKEILGSLNLTEELRAQEPQIVSIKDNFQFGAKEPKVIVTIFSDFTCPYCKNMSFKLRKLSLSYPNDVKIVYKDFPVVNEEGITLALAGRCAGEQNTMFFWKMHDEFFDKQGLITPENISAVGKYIGLDMDKFNECLASEKYMDAIKQDSLEAEALGVKVTPTIFINGYQLPGDLPEEIIFKAVEEFIQNAK